MLARERGKPSALAVGRIADQLDGIGDEVVVDDAVMLRTMAGRLGEVVGQLQTLHGGEGDPRGVAATLHAVAATLRARLAADAASIPSIPAGSVQQRPI